ncbi:NAD-dependent DNA ligase LigA [Alkaliphilus sp. B6464]|uniref:NAD-dependent DNA ligase LigA n=1 Tax=Alkaliphilus sp. B6464 TaxID=2731219 RepID=UPI001BA72E8E|nr:helix-hairpin-helix domain-containing protein [Alkaliphilus sp. B6464]QUH22076.1 hypothetical protein HYG84_19410 [Alkaliphilus sp. B6464]
MNKKIELELELGIELKEKIKTYDHAYYVENKQLVSDAEYDRFMEQYIELEKKHPELKTSDSPTQRVGSDPLSNVPKKTHTTPLLSIENKGKTERDIRKWYEDCGGNGTKILIQPKFDGATVNVSYEDQIYVDAVKRGNGYIGDLITENVKTIRSVPMAISYNEQLEVRGEGIMYCTPFFEKYSKQNGGDYSNPRNLASGTLGLLDPKLVAERKPDIVFFDIGVCKEEFQYDEDRLEWLKSLGFKVTPYKTVDNIDDLLATCMSYFDGKIAEKNGFNILNTDGNVTDILCDGLVLKVSELSKRDELGMTARGPKWAFAFKFKSLTVETVVEDVVIQVGRTGKHTPVGCVNGFIGGTHIQRVTLNNLGYIRTLPPAPYDDIDSIVFKTHDGEYGEIDLEFYPAPDKSDKFLEKHRFLVTDTGKYSIDSIDDLLEVTNKLVVIIKGEEMVVDSIEKLRTIDLSKEIYKINLGDKTFILRKSEILEVAFELYVNGDSKTVEVILPEEYFHLKLNDTVVLERSNDVIPRIIGIRYEKRTGNEKDIVWPENCPTCGEPLEELYPLHFCNSLNCPDRLKGSLLHFASRDAMNIDGLGTSIVELFVDRGYLKDLTDIYILSMYEEEILSIKGFGKRKLTKLYNAIEDTKNRELHQLIYSLGIREVGRTMSKTLAKHFKVLDILMKATYDELVQIKDIGDVAATEIVHFFKSPSNIALINQLKLIGLNMQDNTKEDSDIFKGKIFVITGTLKESRNYYKDIIEKNGGKVSGSVSKKTTIVLIGEDAGSKEATARQLVEEGYPIKLVEGHDDFIKLLQGF